VATVGGEKKTTRGRGNLTAAAAVNHVDLRSERRARQAPLDDDGRRYYNVMRARDRSFLLRRNIIIIILSRRAGGSRPGVFTP